MATSGFVVCPWSNKIPLYTDQDLYQLEESVTISRLAFLAER